MNIYGTNIQVNKLTPHRPVLVGGSETSKVVIYLANAKLSKDELEFMVNDWHISGEVIDIDIRPTPRGYIHGCLVSPRDSQKAL